MKKITRLFLIMLSIIAWGSSVSDLQAAAYCQTPITATDAVTTVRLSCQLISAGNYQIKVESDVAMTNFSTGVYCNINGVGGNQVIALPGYVRSADGKTITVNIPSSSAPNLYTPLYILMPGEKNFAWPAGITWGTCVAQTDFTLPVMGTAALVGSPTYNSANITFTGTDDVTNPVINFVLSDATNSITNKVVVVDASGNGTITGLNPSTTYNFTVKARDAANNVSANSASLQLTTAVRPSECSGDRGHFGNPAVKKIHYTIQYTGGNVIYTVTPFDPARTISLCEVQTTAGNNSMTIASDGKSATYTKTGLTSGTNMGILFMYKLDNMAGNEMTAQTPALTDANSIYYKVGECAVSDTQAPTAFTATKGVVTSTSVELLLNATDNLGIIVYTVSYGAGPTVVSQNGVSGTQKSFIVSGLTPSTDYSFSIEAKDAANNQAANNPIVIPATTTVAPEPQTAAPTPPAYSAPKVISIFSDAFTPIPGTINFNPGWGQATQMSTIQVAGNSTIKYANLNYQGTDFGSDVTVVPMTYLHVDVWTADETSLQFSLINHAPQSEKFVALTPINLNAWNSYDIPLTAYTSQGLLLTNIYQFKVVGSGGKTVYLDNMYFYDPSADVDAQAPTAFTATKGIVASDAVELLLNATDNSGAISYTVSYGAGPTVLTTSGISGTQKSFTVSGLNGSTDYSFSVVAKDATGNVAANSPIVVLATTGAPIPASPTPTAAAAQVLSIYSNAYTATATSLQYVPWWSAGWSDITLADAGNAKKIVTTADGGTGGIQFDNLNVSAMTYFHVDVYPTSTTSSIVKYLVNPVGGGGAGWTFFTGLTANQWNSVNVPVSALALPGTSVSQIGFGTFGGFGTFYVDNIYFYNDLGTGVNQVATNSVKCYPGY